MMITIICCDCRKQRQIKPQDAFQVKRCVDCQKKYTNAMRRVRAEMKHMRRTDDLATLDRIINRFTADGKIDWGDYCWIKFGVWNLNDTDGIRIWGRHECIDLAERSYSDADRKYDMEHLGYTAEEVEDKLARRGADAYIDNEADNCGDINNGREHPSMMKWLIDEARERINR